MRLMPKTKQNKQTNSIIIQINHLKLMEPSCSGSAADLGQWFTSYGGYIHPSVSLSQGAPSNT
jgi:hypothetical protein